MFLFFLLLHLQVWNQAISKLKSNSSDWALHAKSVLDRTRLALANKAESYHRVLQPSAEYLGSLLRVDQWAVCHYPRQFRNIFMSNFGLLLSLAFVLIIASFR